MMERSVELSRFKVNIPIAEAYLRAKIEARSKSNNNNNNGNNNNNNNTDLNRLERIAVLLNKASLTFNQALNANGSKRRELLEEAFKAYTDIVPYLGVSPYLTYTVLKQIKNIEAMIELEMENGVKSGNVNAIDISIDEVMKKAREAFL